MFTEISAHHMMGMLTDESLDKQIYMERQNFKY